MLTFCFSDLERLYRPSMGFAAAKMDVRAFRVAYSPKVIKIKFSKIEFSKIKVTHFSSFGVSELTPPP